MGLQFVDLKTRQSRRKVTLLSIALEALQAHPVSQANRRLQMGPKRADFDLVFTNETGTPPDPMNAYHRFQKALHAGWLPPMRLHDLRHTAATFMPAAGLDPVTIHRTLGHASITLTLSTYSDITPSMHRESLAKMDGPLRSVGTLSNQTGQMPDAFPQVLQRLRPVGAQTLFFVRCIWLYHWGNSGERPGTRTPNLVIKSHLLCQLS
jgi:hypothetical protein